MAVGRISAEYKSDGVAFAPALYEYNFWLVARYAISWE